MNKVRALFAVILYKQRIISVTIIDSKYSINIVYFNSLFIIISIKSILTFIRGSFNSSSFIIKSIITTYYFLIRAVLGYSFP